jgi:hypothetical protein
VIDLVAPERLIFTYGYTSGTPIASGASLVSITLSEDGANTRLHLTHAFSDAAVRDEHVQGWRYQLALFSNVVANEVCYHAVAHIDAWLGAWSDTDPERRAATFARIAAADVRFSDPVSTVESLGDLSVHLDAVLDSCQAYGSSAMA